MEEVEAMEEGSQTQTSGQGLQGQDKREDENMNTSMTKLEEEGTTSERNNTNTTIEEEGGDKDNNNEKRGQGQGGRASLKDVVITMLDQMDERVEKLRSSAASIESEKEDVLSTLDSIMNAEMATRLSDVDQDEVARYAERLTRRCMAVNVEIREERAPGQLESLHKVNNMIDNLIRDAQVDPFTGRRKCVTFLNACLEEVSSGTTVVTQEIDSKFESAVLECCIEDQKRIKKRLKGLYSYFAQTLTVLEEGGEEESIAVERSFSQT